MKAAMMKSYRIYEANAGKSYYKGGAGLVGTAGLVAVLTDRAGRGQVGVGHRQHPRGEGHVGGGQPVADGELGPAGLATVGQVVDMALRGRRTRG